MIERSLADLETLPIEEVYTQYTIAMANRQQAISEGHIVAVGFYNTLAKRILDIYFVKVEIALIGFRPDGLEKILSRET